MTPTIPDVKGLICVALLSRCIVYTQGGAGTTVGQLFVVATMKLIGNSSRPSWPIGSVEFFLYTASPSLVLVNVSLGSVYLHNTSVSTFGQKHFTANDSFIKSTKDLAFTPAYVFRGSGLFGLCVFMLDSMPVDSFETYLAIPVESWGKNYFLVSLEWHAFSLSACENVKLSSSFTGSSVSGTSPFGVISGSCFGGTQNVFCGNHTEGGQTVRQNKAVDMLMPREQYGQEFVLFFVRDKTSRGYIAVVAGADDVTVTHSKALGDLELLHVKNEGDFLQVSLKGGPSLLKSDKGILVMHVMRSACSGEVGGPSFCMIVPTELFYYTYVWSTPVSSQASTVRHYIYVVIKEVCINQLNFDGEFLLADSITWNCVNGNPAWRAGHAAVKAGTHRLLHEYKSRFGLYLYGLERYRAYMHPAGFIAAPVNLMCSRSPTVADDLLDNDCDKNIDEEVQDGLDNDGDGMMDEDIRNTTEKERMEQNKTHEDYIKDEWSIWTEWQCQACADRRLFRTRNCNQPTNQSNVRGCHGNRVEAKDGNCYVGAKCPEDCPVHYWSINCSRTCFNCQGDCRKYSGICGRCTRGYKFPHNGCQTACGTNEYGENCEGNCYDKCAVDCYNRANGDCFALPNPASSIILLMMPIIIATVVLGIWACNRQDTSVLPHAGQSTDPLSETTQLSTSSIRELLSNRKDPEAPRAKAPRLEAPLVEAPLAEPVDDRPLNAFSVADTHVSMDSEV